MKKYASKFLAIVSLFSLFLQSAYPVILAYENTDAGSGTSCTLSVDKTSVTQGESVTFTLNSGYGYSAYWRGDNNGQSIGGNYQLDGFSGIEAANSWQRPYRQDTTGTFNRYVEILNEEGNVICTTDTVTVNVAPQNEPPIEPSTPLPTPNPWNDYSGGINPGQTQNPDAPPEPATLSKTPNTHYEGESCEPSVSCSTSVPNAEDSSKPLYCRSIGQDNYQRVTRDYANSRCNENNINLTAVCNEQTFYCNGTTWSSEPNTPTQIPSPTPKVEPAASSQPTAELPTTTPYIPVVTDPTSQETARETTEGLAMRYARERMQSFAIDRQQTEKGSQNNLAYTLDQATETAGNTISTATGAVGNTARQINSTVQNFGIGSQSPPPSAITCSLTVEPTTVEAGQAVKYTINSSAYGYSAFWKGSENGQPINYQVEDFQNTNYWTKTYTHNTAGTLNYQVQVLNDAGGTLCTTSPVEIRVTERTVQQPKDSLKEQQTLDRFNEANKDLGIRVSGNLSNPTFSVQATSTYATTAASGTQSLFDSPKEEQKKFFTESKKRVDSMVLTTADFFLAGVPDILINKAADLADQYSLTTDVCQKAEVDVLFDPSYREQITGSIKLKGRTGLDFKQWQDFAKTVNPSSSNPFSEEQIEQGRQKAYELIKTRLDSTSFAYQSRLNEVNGMNEEQAKQGCTQAFGEFIANQKEMENELQSVEIMLLAQGPINTAQEAGLKAAAPVVKKVTNPIGKALGNAWNATAGRLFRGGTEEILTSPTVISTTAAPEKTFLKYAAGSSQPERFGITYRSGGEQEFNRLKQLHEVAPDNVPKPIRMLWNSEAFEPEVIEMEFVQGVTAREYINTNGSLPEEIKTQIRAVVDKFHKNGLAHGDLNPNNIIITPEGKVKFIDPVAYKDFTPEMAALDRQILDEWIGSEFIKGGRKTNPAQLGTVSEAVARSTQEIAQEAASVANEFFPEGTGSWKDIVQHWLMEGKSREEIGDALRGSKKLVDYMESNKGVISPIPGRTDLQPQQVLRPPGQDAPKEVLEAWNALNYSGVGMEGLRGGPSYLLVNTAEAILEQRRGVSSIDYVLDDTKNLLNRLKSFCIEHISDPSWCNAVNPGAVANPSAIHLVSDRDMHIFAGTNHVGGLYDPDDKQILLNKDFFGGRVVSVCLHEGIHKSCGLNNPEASEILTQSLLRQGFSRLQAVEWFMARQNMRKLDEGLTEFATQWAYRLSGMNPTFKAFPQAVSAVENDIVGEIMESSGRSKEEAVAVVIEAALTGSYERLFKEAGGGDLKRGVALVNNILDSIPSVDPRIQPPSGLIVTNGATTPARLFLATTEAGLVVAAGGIALEGYENPQPGQENPENQPLLPQLLPWRITNEVFAQEATKQQEPKVDAQKFESLVKKYLIKNALVEYGEVDSEFVGQVMKMDISPSRVQVTTDGYMFTTGRAGHSESSIEPNRYMVNVDGISGVDIKIPGVVEVKAGQKTVIPVAIKKGTGKVEKTVPPTGWQWLLNKLFGTVFAQEKKESQVQLMVFSDTNNNGRIDKDEQVLPWAGLKVELKKVNQDRTLSLIPGWNLVTLEVLPAKPINASTLLQEIAKQGGYATTVSTLENGAWKSFVVRGDKTYSGDDFPITAGKAYFVKALKSSVLVYQGQELVAPIKLNLASGWNSVGVPYSAKPYQAADFIDTINAKGAGSDTASRWESGLWDTFVKQQDQRYGENFMIEQGRGYLLKVAKGLEFSP